MDPEADMRILAVDYGSVRIGLARSDELGLLASPLPCYIRTASIKKDARIIAEMAESSEACLVIVGYPLTLEGERGRMAVDAEAFGERISRYTRIPVKMLDERYTSFQAESQLREAGRNSRKAKLQIDSQSAVVLLQDYLDAMGKR